MALEDKRQKEKDKRNILKEPRKKKRKKESNVEKSESPKSKVTLEDKRQKEKDKSIKNANARRSERA